MNETAHLSRLAHAETRAVIINCGTKWVSSLALLSTVRYTSCPVLLINCESRDGSREHFRRLGWKANLEFDWLEWPLRPHHAALDQLFAEIRADRVLLVDSDMEILSARVVQAMLQQLSDDGLAYGSGFLHGPSWVGSEQGLHERAGYYVERMWIPLTLLRTEAIRAASRSGVSFGGRRSFQDLPGFPRIARLLGYRYRLPYLRKLRLPRGWQAGKAGNAEALTAWPSYLDFDTGAVLHQSLLTRGYRFSSVPDELRSQLRHLHGVTRTAVAGRFRKVIGHLGIAVTETDRSERSVLAHVMDRLSAEYGL